MEEEIRSKYKYDPSSGVFYGPYGNKVGSYTRKYGRIFFKGKQYYLAKLAVLLQTGSWPEGEVDHIDGDTHNNKWDNLRVCSREENAKNRRKYSNNSSGFKGVSLELSGRYRSKIQVNNVQHYLGTFSSKEEAASAYNQAAIKNFGRFASLNNI